MAYPVARKLTRMSGAFGPRKPIPLGGGKFSPSFHGGVDFTPLEKGSRIPAYSVGTGVVYGINLGGGAAGRNVMVRLDGDGSHWWYGHLSRVDVVKGQRVRDGQQLGLIGATGNTTGVHLHLERHWPRMDVETDPWPYIKDARDIDGNTSSWQTGNPPVAVGDSSTAIPAPGQTEASAAARIPKGDDDMFVCKQNDTGHIYTIGKQYIRHEENPRTAQYVANVLTVDDTIIPMGGEEFASILDAHGIPRAAPAKVIGGKLWSVATGVIDARNLDIK